LPDNQSNGDEFLDRIVSATIITWFVLPT